jgi:hypothetical protein
MNSSLGFWADSALGFAVPVATVLIAASVALITWFQWKTNREKLRLDLFQRRYEIYLRVRDYQSALLQRHDERRLAEVRGTFGNALRESKFLFPQKSGIYDLFGDFDGRAARVTTFKRYSAEGTCLTSDDRAQLTEDEIWIAHGIEILEKKLGPYLNFRSI